MDGWDMVRETTGSSTTSYLIPEGGLLSFNRDGVRFDCHMDALGSVRLVTDEEGEVVSRFNLGAYGEMLAGSFDGVPGGLPYLWVGGLGVRADTITGLHYMRRRWYSAQLGRFLSRDPIGISGGVNLYGYVDCSPMMGTDESGLNWWEPLNRAQKIGREEWNWLQSL